MSFFRKKEKGKLGKELTGEQVVSSTASVRQPSFVDTVAYDLTPNRLHRIIQDLRVGEARDYLTLAEELEEKDPHYRSVIGTRKLQVCSLDSTMELADDSAKSATIADDVTNTILHADWYEVLKLNLLDALAKGYSVAEIIWSASEDCWWPKAVIWRDPRYFRYARERLDHLVLDNAGMEEELVGKKFIIHQPTLKSGFQLRNGLALPAAYYTMVKHVDIAGWAAFAQVYGYPLRIGRYGRSASDADKKILRRAIASLGHDVGAVIPENMQIEIINALTGTGNITLYEHLADYIDKQISKAVLGQTMSADAEGGQYKGDLHNEIRLTIAKADAKALAATIQRDLIVPYIDANYGAQSTYPELKIAVPEPEDFPALVEALEKLVPLGFRVKTDELYTKLNLTRPTDDDEILTIASSSSGQGLGRSETAIGKALNRQGGTAYGNGMDAVDGLPESDDSDWEGLADPIVDAITEAAGGSDSFEELRAKLLEIERRFELDPQIAEKIAVATFKARVSGRAHFAGGSDD